MIDGIVENQEKTELMNQICRILLITSTDIFF